MKSAWIVMTKDGDPLWASFDKDRAIQWASNSTIVDTKERAGRVVNVTFDDDEELEGVVDSE